MPFLGRRRNKQRMPREEPTTASAADPSTTESTPLQYPSQLRPAAKPSPSSKWSKWMACLTRTSSNAGATSGRKRSNSKRLKNNRSSFVIDRVLFSHDGQPLRNMPTTAPTTANDSAISLAAEAPPSHTRSRTNDSGMPTLARLSSTSQSFASRTINLKRVLKPTDPSAPLPQPEPHWPQQPPTPTEPAHQRRREHGARPSAMTIARALNIPPPPLPPPPTSVPKVHAFPPHFLEVHTRQQPQSTHLGRESPVVGFRRSLGAPGAPSSSIPASQPFGSRPARPTGMVFLPPYLGDEQQHSTMSLIGQMQHHQHLSGLANVREKPEAEQPLRRHSQLEQQQDMAPNPSPSRHAPQPQPFVLPSIESSLSQSLGKQQQSTSRPLSIVFPSRALPPHSYDMDLPVGYRRDFASQAYVSGSAGRQRPLSMAIPSSYSSLESTSGGMIASSWGRQVVNAGAEPDQPVGFRRPSAYHQRPRPTSLLSQARHQAASQRHEYHQLESPVDLPSSYDSKNDPIVGFRRSFGSLQPPSGRPNSVPNWHAAAAGAVQEDLAPGNLRTERHLPRPNSLITSSYVQHQEHHTSLHHQYHRSHIAHDQQPPQQREDASSLASSLPRSTPRRPGVSLLRMPSLNSIRNTPHVLSADLHGGYSRSRAVSNASSHRRSSYLGAPRTSLLARELASQSVLPPFTGPGLSYWPLDLGLPLTSVQVSANMHRYSRTKADDLSDAYGLAALLETWTDLHTRLAHIVEDHVGRVGARVSTCHAMQAALTHIAAPLAHRNVAATHSTFVATHVRDLAGDFTGMPLPECGGAPSIVTTHSVFVALDAAAPSALVKYIAPLADHGAQAVATALSLSGGPTEDLDNWVSEYLLFWIRLKRERPGVAAFVFAPFSVLKEPAAAAMVEVVGGGAAASPNKAGAAGNNGDSVVVQGTLVPGLWDARKAMLVAPAAVWVK